MEQKVTDMEIQRTDFFLLKWKHAFYFYFVIICIYPFRKKFRSMCVDQDKQKSK